MGRSTLAWVPSLSGVRNTLSGLTCSRTPDVDKSTADKSSAVRGVDNKMPTKREAASLRQGEPTDEQLRLVARHGSGPFERALAAAQLAKRQGREDELRRRIDEVTD